MRRILPVLLAFHLLAGSVAWAVDVHDVGGTAEPQHDSTKSQDGAPCQNGALCGMCFTGCHVPAILPTPVSISPQTLRQTPESVSVPLLPLESTAPPLPPPKH